MQQKKRSKFITILIVPQNNAEPYSFRFKAGLVRVLYVVAAILVVHVVTGGIFYWKYAKLNHAHQVVISDNIQLKEDNKRVVALYDEFYALEKAYKKVKILLGVDEQFAYASHAGTREQIAPLFDNIVAAVRVERPSQFKRIEAPGSYFLAPKKSPIHNYAENLPTLLPVKGFVAMDFQKNGWFLPQSHNGIDIVAKKGTVIRAAGAGVVVIASWTYDYGNLIIIDHGGGIFSYYGHNQRLLKYERSYVRKGEALALLGTSGKSSGPHLHFEIRKDGVPVNPREYILAFNDNITANPTTNRDL